jgi:hypothetical protein
MLLRCWVKAANKSRSKDHFQIALRIGEEVRAKLEHAGEKNSIAFAEVLKDIAGNYSNFGKGLSFQ